VVLTHLLDLKEVLTGFPLAQASHTLPSLYVMVGRSTTRSFEPIYLREKDLHDLVSSAIALYHHLKHSNKSTYFGEGKK